MARFFIDRPIFAWVVSILIMLLGGLAITQLPIAQYPSVAPPSIHVVKQRCLGTGDGHIVFHTGNRS
jgi:multidrug efflux pump subunit AcrB